MTRAELYRFIEQVDHDDGQVTPAPVGYVLEGVRLGYLPSAAADVGVGPMSTPTLLRRPAPAEAA
jgi:hypothetical protein